MNTPNSSQRIFLKNAAPAGLGKRTVLANLSCLSRNYGRVGAALALIADYHLGETRSRAVGVHQTGIYLGQILGGFAGYAADSPEHGWRWMFTTCGMIGLIYALPLIAALRDPTKPAAKYS